MIVLAVFNFTLLLRLRCSGQTWRDKLIWSRLDQHQEGYNLKMLKPIAALNAKVAYDLVAAPAIKTTRELRG
jgi:hypothetical protein